MTTLSSRLNSSGLVPVGSIIPAGRSSAPSGYLACDGSPVSRTTYKNLFAVIGTTHGAGDGSTTFNLPDTRGLFIRGTGSQTISSKTFNGGSVGSKARDKTGKNGLSLTTSSTPSLSLSNTDLTHTHSYNDLTTTFSNIQNDIYNQISGTAAVSGTNSIEADTTGSSLGSHGHTITPSITGIVTTLSSSGTETKPASISVNHYIKF